jgi:hypothetical protein
MSKLIVDIDEGLFNEGVDYTIELPAGLVETTGVVAFPSLALTTVARPAWTGASAIDVTTGVMFDPSNVSVTHRGRSVIDTDASVEYINGGYGTTHMVYDDDQIVIESNTANAQTGWVMHVTNTTDSLEFETTLDSSNMPRTLIVPDTLPIVISSNSSVGDVVGETEHYEFIYGSMSSTYDFDDLTTMNIRINFDDNIHYMGSARIRGTGNVLIYNSLGLLHQTITPAECTRTIQTHPTLDFVVTGISESETYTITLEDDVFEAAVNLQLPTNYIGNAEMLNITSFTMGVHDVMCEIDVNYGDWVSIFNEGEYYVDWGNGTFQLYNTNDTRSTTMSNLVRIKTYSSSLNPLTKLEIKGNGVLSIDLDCGTLPSLDNFCFNDHSHSTMNLSNLTTVNLSGAINVTSMDSAFYMCSSLHTVNLSGTINVTSMDSAFYMCTSLTSFPLIDTSSVTSMTNTWMNCYSLTSFPLIDTSSVTSMTYVWSGCSSLTSFPLIDTSSVTSMTGAWKYCHALTSFPLIDTSSVTSMTGAWKSCTSLTSFPLINTSSVTSMTYAWSWCTSLTSFPLINTSSVTSMTGAWHYCRALTSFPLINTSSVTNMDYAWEFCHELTSFPLIDTSTVFYMIGAWLGCSSLTSFPLINTSTVVAIANTWLACSSLTSFPSIDTSRVHYMYGAWEGCSSLTSFPSINTFRVWTMGSAFSGCTSLVCIPNLFTINTWDNWQGTEELFYNTPLLQQPDASAQADLTSVNGADWTNANPCP